MAATIRLRDFPEAADYTCPHCKHTGTRYDPEGSVYTVCTSCNSYLHFAPGRGPQVQQPVSSIQYQPVLGLGLVGTLRDIPYKVIGYMEKKDPEDYEWREYMLYSYTMGYAFLAEYAGHWSLVVGKQYYPELANAAESFDVATYNGGDYLLFNAYTPIITALQGEYDWDVYEERVSTREFINPPFLVVKEKNKANQRVVDWYLGEYITPDEISGAFNIPLDTFPTMVDIGANQPSPYQKRWSEILKVSIISFVLLALLQVVIFVMRPQQVIFNKDISLSLPPAPPPDTTKHDSTTSMPFTASTANGNYEYKSLKTSSFTIYSGPAPVEVDIAAGIDNNWFEATVELVSEKDNQTWDVSKEIEFYHGYEDGESWSEGSTSGTALLPDIPPGKYHINIYPYGGTSDIDHMNIQVSANVTLWQNILITLALLCIYPLYCWFMKRQFEVNRWMGSNYSPYKKTTSSDD